jgi:hypothetical protein
VKNRKKCIYKPLKSAVKKREKSSNIEELETVMQSCQQ